jgi:hypothetical protein
MCSALSAFTSTYFDPIFSDTAVAPWAKYIAHIDLETHQKQARAAIHEVVRNAFLPLPSQRVVLIEGRAGFGKTHVIVAELWKLSQTGAVYPVIMQLSVMLSPEDISHGCCAPQSMSSAEQISTMRRTGPRSNALPIVFGSTPNPGGGRPTDELSRKEMTAEPWHWPERQRQRSMLA